MRCICRLCHRVVRKQRSSHLSQFHGIKLGYGQAREYFLRPEELGLTQRYVDELLEGAKV